MSDADFQKKMIELVSQIKNEAADIQERIDKIEAERGPLPELAWAKDSLRMSRQIDPGMSADEIRLLLLKTSGGAQ